MKSVGYDGRPQHSNGDVMQSLPSALELAMMCAVSATKLIETRSPYVRPILKIGFNQIYAFPTILAYPLGFLVDNFFPNLSTLLSFADHFGPQI